MSIDHSDFSDHSVRGTAGRREKGRREVLCKICQAVYVPARTHAQLARSPQPVIESAFMSMCHFCFRCRRPACPSCWDEVHKLCGACAVEARLPFRSSVPPLDGTIVPPIQHSPAVRVHSGTPPLVCVQPGRFQCDPLPIETQTTLYIQTISDPLHDDVGKKHLSLKLSTPDSKPQPRAIDIIADAATRPEKKDVDDKDGIRKARVRYDKLMLVVTTTLLLIALLVVVLIVSALFAPM